ncbi:MAG: ATP-binding cassette domain-containing protein [Phycisphaera sp.]|nr:ATP-binding cassette domain-containing protein [Phycisphaera sp.]
MPHDDAVVITRDLTKKYGDFVALDSLSITLARGNILGFIGPNGAGKTTTIKILVGLARPTSGSATVAGVDCVRDAQKIKRLVGYMPDTFGSYDNMRVREYLDFFGAAFKIPRKERLKRIEAVMETTGSTYMKDRFVESLSHGMKQRVGIARTLLHDPQVLILDEPANGLDPQARIEMRQILLRLADMGKTLIVTSHILPELSRICNQVAIITHGKLRAFGSLDKITHMVTQRRGVEVQLADNANLARVAQLVKDNVDDAQEVAPSEAESIVRFTTAKDEKYLGDILAMLVGAGVGVTQFRELQTDLEDAFLSVTRSEIGSGDRAPAAV